MDSSESRDQYSQLVSDIFENIAFNANGDLVDFDVFLYGLTRKIESRVSRSELLSIMRNQHDLISRALKMFTDVDKVFLRESVSIFNF